MTAVDVLGTSVAFIARDYPQALGTTIREAARIAGIPVIITENGLASEDDTQRVEYLRAAVDSEASCLADGIDVRGYIAWTAFDNYEWVFGYRPKFGLIAVNRTTQERIPKESARWLGHQAQEHASRTGLDTPSDVVQPAGHRQGAAVGSTDGGPLSRGAYVRR
jgi:beta-glucosidase